MMIRPYDLFSDSIFKFDDEGPVVAFGQNLFKIFVGFGFGGKAIYSNMLIN